MQVWKFSEYSVSKVTFLFKNLIFDKTSLFNSFGCLRQNSSTFLTFRCLKCLKYFNFLIEKFAFYRNLQLFEKTNL